MQRQPVDDKDAKAAWEDKLSEHHAGVLILNLMRIPAVVLLEMPSLEMGCTHSQLWLHNKDGLEGLTDEGAAAYSVWLDARSHARRSADLTPYQSAADVFTQWCAFLL